MMDGWLCRLAWRVGFMPGQDGDTWHNARHPTATTMEGWRGNNGQDGREG